MLRKLSERRNNNEKIFLKGVSMGLWLELKSYVKSRTHFQVLLLHFLACPTHKKLFL